MKFNNLFCKEYKDQFNFYNTIRKTNPSYKLYFDDKNKKFLVVNIRRNYEICMVFNSFFKYIENDLRFSKVENFNKIIKYIDDENDKLQDKFINNSNNKINYSLKEFNTIHNRSNTLKQEDINKIIGAIKC